MWTTHPSFRQTVLNSWTQLTTASSLIQLVTQKLKRLKATLKNWNHVVFKNIYVEMEEASEALNAIPVEAALYGDTEDQLLTEIDCTVRLNTIMHQHQINSTQRNHLQWLQDGDRNSQFFHTMNRIRKTSVGLSSLIVNGELTFDPGIIADSVVQFYTELFTAQDQTTYDDSVLGAFIHPVVDATENDTLIALPSVEEIHRAVFDMKPSSSPGHDGSGGSFYQAYWDIISFDVIEAASTGCSFGLWGLSGQIYNPAKSTVYYGTAVTRRVRRMMLRITGISHGSLPISYLGVPLFKGPPRTGHLAALADSIISKFSKWKGHSLSLAGRKCLINSVIAASLVHSMMIYYWPRTLLKKIEDVMLNFHWKDMTLLHSRFITEGGKPRNLGRPSSIEPGIRRHLGWLATNSRWIVGHYSGISFWNDNWLGYIISERIGIPHSFDVGLNSTIWDFFYDECWHFDYEFFMKHTDIVRDILSIHVSRGSDRRVWGNSVSGLLTSRMAYDLLRSPNPRVNWASWIWGHFIPPYRSTLFWRAI
ncbi:hypothetical protein ACS0TY_006665 [Phlomoides rotata]